MNNRVLPPIGILCVVSILMSSGPHAQTLPAAWSTGTGGNGTGTVDFEMRTDGTLIEKGVGSALGLSGTDEGAGTRLLWYPNLSAFRAGTVTGTDWDLSNIGQYSLSFGLDNLAGNTGSMAFGGNNWSGGQWSVVLGYYNSAAGDYSIALGSYSATHWQQGVAIGTICNGTGYQAVAIGVGASATNNGALALGYGANSTGGYSIALNNCTSTGWASLGSGWSNLASADFSVSLNAYTASTSYCETALGKYNVGGGTSATTWVATDPLLEVGNGTSSSATSDAMVLYKNGNATFQGVVTVAPTPDIPMYQGN